MEALSTPPPLQEIEMVFQDMFRVNGAVSRGFSKEEFIALS